MSTLAYYDTFAGLIPCTAVGLVGERIMLRVNANRGAYKRGELIEGSRLRAYPREHFHRSKRGPFHFYTTPYSWDALLNDGSAA